MTNQVNGITSDLKTTSLEQFNLSIEEIDDIANDALQKFNVPGASIRNQIIDKILDFSDIDWMNKVQETRKKTKDTLDNALKLFHENDQALSIQRLEDYAGRYVHPAYGVVEFKIENNNLLLCYGTMEEPIRFTSDISYTCQCSKLLIYGINPVVDSKFFKDSSGTVYKVEIPFEGFRSAKPITFTRRASP